MRIKQAIERLVLVVLLVLVTLQLGGAVVNADLCETVVAPAVDAASEKMAAQYTRVVPVPRNDVEACRMMLRLVR